MLRNLTFFCISLWKLAKLAQCPSSHHMPGGPLRYSILQAFYLYIVKGHIFILLAIRSSLCTLVHCFKRYDNVDHSDIDYFCNGGLQWTGQRHGKLTQALEEDR